jgi:hypothetical protein
MIFKKITKKNNKSTETKYYFLGFNWMTIEQPIYW